MKPTYQTGHQPRHIESQRPHGTAFTKQPATDWQFQSGAELHVGTATAAAATEQPASNGNSLFNLMQGYEAETKRQDRAEALGLFAVIAIAAWPMAHAIYMAARTV
jgi:hypothetical protein